MWKNLEPIRHCKTCAHWSLPADSQVCRECWNYRRWANWTPAKGEEKK